MRPETHHLLLVALFSCVLVPATAVCVPRNSSNSIYHATTSPPAFVVNYGSSSRPSPTPASYQPSLSPPPSPLSPAKYVPSSSPPPPTPVSYQPPTSSPPPPTPVSYQPPTSSPPPPVRYQRISSQPTPAGSLGSTSPSGYSSPSTQLPIRDAVSALCSKTDYPDVCSSTIQSFPALVGPVDAAVMLKLHMKACREKAQIAQSQVSALVSHPGASSKLASSLQVCSDMYDDVFDSLDTAADAMASHDKGTLDSMLSGLISDFSTCEDAFTEDSITSPMAAVDDRLTKLASNCLAFSSLL
ncbi:vegetative cell wall protein gp1-like [Musa acuminata AAA Group]|uniref:vegetative cell wall protein gp1-like n=1 Tax=Musa acuminata AAA Group TaxID=214697 RepID=UPI0031CF3C86